DGASRGPGEQMGRHRSGPRAELARRYQPGRALHGPVLGRQPLLEGRHAGREEAERLDHVTERLLELTLLPGRGPDAAIAAQPAPSPRRLAVSLERVGEARGAGVVRAVAVAEDGEGAQEVPSVAALGGQPVEGCVQGPGRTCLVSWREGAGIACITGWRHG